MSVVALQVRVTRRPGEARAVRQRTHPAAPAQPPACPARGTEPATLSSPLLGRVHVVFLPRRPLPGPCVAAPGSGCRPLAAVLACGRGFGADLARAPLPLARVRYCPGSVLTEPRQWDCRGRRQVRVRVALLRVATSFSRAARFVPAALQEDARFPRPPGRHALSCWPWNFSAASSGPFGES